MPVNSKLIKRQPTASEKKGNEGRVKLFKEGKTIKTGAYIETGTLCKQRANYSPKRFLEGPLCCTEWNVSFITI